MAGRAKIKKRAGAPAYGSHRPPLIHLIVYGTGHNGRYVHDAIGRYGPRVKPGPDYFYANPQYKGRRA